jgi:predicted HTH transcriptional regulator
MRFVGLADKIGLGIDLVYKTVLSGGFDFPVFESANNTFRATIPLERSRDFQNFVHRRGASLSQLDELVILRYLWRVGESDFKHLSDVLQRGAEIARRIVQSMQNKMMIEVSGGMFSLTYSIRADIEHPFDDNQLLLDLYGAA